MFIKAINSFWTKVCVKDIRSKKTLQYFKTNSLRVGTTLLVWKNLETARQVKRSIVRARILTGTYALQATRHIFSKESINQTCLHCQLEDEDLHHMVCRCPAFYEYRVLALKQLLETAIQDSSDSVWDCHFKLHKLVSYS